MKTITYEFADGTKSEIEVDDEWAEFVTVSRREEESYERKERYHTAIHLDWCDYEGDWFADNNTPETAYEKEIREQELLEQEARVVDFISLLTPIQRRRLQYKLDDPKISNREIARIEGVDIRAVNDSFIGIQKKFNKFYRKSTPQK